VPVHFINEEIVAKTGATINHHVNEISINCLPGVLPEFIEVDLANLELGQTLHLSDVVFPEGVVSDELAKGESHDQAVVTAKAPKVSADDAEETEEAAAE
jgi:large subunit ribosomal protein L25